MEPPSGAPRGVHDLQRAHWRKRPRPRNIRPTVVGSAHIPGTEWQALAAAAHGEVFRAASATGSLWQPWKTGPYCTGPGLGLPELRLLLLVGGPEGPELALVWELTGSSLSSAKSAGGTGAPPPLPGRGGPHCPMAAVPHPLSGLARPASPARTAVQATSAGACPTCRLLAPQLRPSSRRVCRSSCASRRTPDVSVRVSCCFDQGRRALIVMARGLSELRLLLSLPSLCFAGATSDRPRLHRMHRDRFRFCGRRRASRFRSSRHGVFWERRFAADLPRMHR
jgi:hypothetical protein